MSTAFDRPIVNNVVTGPDATVDHIAASYTGGTANENLVAVVFNGPDGSRAITGLAQTRNIVGRDRVSVIRVANVVVLYTHKRGTIDRGPALRSALLANCRPCRDGVRPSTAR